MDTETRKYLFGYLMSKKTYSLVQMHKKESEKESKVKQAFAAGLLGPDAPYAGFLTEYLDMMEMEIRYRIIQN